MSDSVELEVCANCKREIPHYNYVMHTAHCARNITLCGVCKEPIPKNEFEKHAKSCMLSKTKTNHVTPTKFEQSTYYSARKEVEDKKVQQRKEKRLEKMEKLTSGAKTVGHSHSKSPKSTIEAHPQPAPANHLLPCQYCEIELPKLELGEHESYCGARTEKCEDCGENVMFRYRQLHLDTNHSYAGSGTRPAESTRRSVPLASLIDVPLYTPFPPNRPLLSTTSSTGEKLETSREISRRLDCKTEYIRNLLHDSASITAPIRSTGAIPRYQQRDNPPRRRNPPTELVIPCEFCNTPIPHDDLIEHETGCRPDLVRYNPRREIDDLSYVLSPEPGSPLDVELPCEFCSDLIPASQLLSHQAACN